MYMGWLLFTELIYVISLPLISMHVIYIHYNEQSSAYSKKYGCHSYEAKEEHMYIVDIDLNTQFYKTSYLGQT